MTIILAVVPLLLLFLGAAAAVGYFLVEVPRRWGGPYEQALALLAGDTGEELDKAERQLVEAVNAGPRGQALSHIRLARICVRAKQGAYEPDRYAAAAAMLEEHLDAEGRTGDTAVLELWLQARMENHERVVELCADNTDLLELHPDSRRIAAISHFRLAVDHWRRREADGAVRHFDQVRKLGELTELVPQQLGDLQLARGIRDVFDGQLGDARDHFTDARDRAARQGLPTLEAELGLAVCAWGNGDPRELGDRLGELAEQVPAQPAGDGSAADGAQKDDPDSDETAEDAAAADESAVDLSSGIAVLRLVALLREWLGREPLSGAPSPVDFAELERRAQAGREADPKLGAPNLVEGLIRYYFALSQPERDRALDVLERDDAAAKNVWPPEVLELVRRERELGGEGDAMSRYLALISEFLDDSGRSEQDLAKLRALKERFARFGTPVESDGAQPLQPSAAEDQRHRAEVLRRRIELIVYPRVRDLPDDAPARGVLRDLLAELDKAANVAADGAGVMQQAELKLIIITAQTLLPEESDVPEHV
ncbi:hypothetical protein [Catenulispora pinisilvae]|uniref:hypothetical protein n=1 Tax=Catenulispora pinisilvae TaxID=2705253 RepID=UPI0018917DEB|nr:hypothetical protein [Catenulispora pinisilvae]